MEKPQAQLHSYLLIMQHLKLSLKNTHCAVSQIYAFIDSDTLAVEMRVICSYMNNCHLIISQFAEHLDLYQH